ncbi:MAG: aminoacyl-tRNA hydrolase, partial [Bacilli bacterium]|nr:aminoacyl-tRNA hydrolase [Bacilli bacterium]
MKLIVGLGNPGKEYENTRHNIGFMVIDRYISKYNYLPYKEKFNGIYYEDNIDGEKVILLKPQKYMNLSGEVVISYLNYFKINVEDMLVISDDLDMPLGKIKLKLSGSCGGHNGLRNIENNIGTQNYKRLKIGISNNKEYDTKDYVL